MDLRQRVTVMQIIAIALMTSVGVYAVVTIGIAWSEPQVEGPVKFAGLVLAVLTPMPLLIVPSLINPAAAPSERVVGESVGSEPPAELLGVYQTRLIVRLALLEGAAFLNLVAFQIEHARWSLVVALAMLLVMYTYFSTRVRVEQWLEGEQLHRV